MLNLDAISNGVMQEYPYQWILFDNLIPKSQLIELRNTFPPIEVFPKREKPHHRPAIVVYDDAEEFIDESRKKNYYPSTSLSSIWQSLVEELHSSAYRESIAKLTGLNLEQQFISIFLSRLDPIVNGSHSDSEGIILAHLLYFGREDWKIEWGGCLQILLNEQLESLFQEIPPRNGNSVVLVRSENSWHNVSPVSSPEASQDRLNILVRFYDRATVLKWIAHND
ncbi:MAG: 2OG-Fe(II) oxygenase family protein [Nostoc sp.]|uniref:2OG-Fe(II) oxygenase family protein n=1 Tax=Nostoc sp. TaxID=1180 RepID=UPI002FFB5136